MQYARSLQPYSQVRRDAVREALFSSGKEGFRRPLAVLVDSVTVASTERPLLVVDLRAERGRCVRVVAAELWSIESNFSGANLDFDEFANAVGDHGVFRGF